MLELVEAYHRTLPQAVAIALQIFMLHLGLELAQGHRLLQQAIRFRRRMQGPTLLSAPALFLLTWPGPFAIVSESDALNGFTCQEERTVIEVNNLVKSYGAHEVLRGVSFTIRPGEAAAYLGPNGAGKSTTVKIIVGLLRQNAGQVRVCGHDIDQEPVQAKLRLGYVPDSAALFNSLTPNEYLSLIAELYHMEPPHARERMGLMCNAFETHDILDRPIETLSRGQRQKVLIMAALLHDPDVILLDEPLNGLDVNTALTFRRVLERLIARGKTILFCSHIFEVIERICSRVIVINQGRIVADQPTSDLLKRTKQGTLEAIFRELTRKDAVDEGARAFLDALDKEGFAPKTPSEDR
jgi:ABC-2 type transport system ATP-binding protein